MKLLLFCLTSWIIFNSSGVIFASTERYSPRYLKGATISWEENQLSGQLTLVPVQGLLEDLLQSGGDKWQVIGDLKGTVSIRFDHLTIEECIKKIMRQGNYNYTLIQSVPQFPIVRGTHNIKELNIYIDQIIVRFMQTVLVIPNDESLNVVRKASHKENSAIGEDAFDGESLEGTNYIEQSQESGSQNVELPDEIKKFVDELFKDKEISKEEYERTLSTFGSGNK